ncbi:MAG: MBL fold metallo-hydrolase [Sulfolobales archaeon]|nr:MBL fold metallo-hydrolase [Sulfolobales archaeon]MCX8209119.1 MBL fold metallo-hydrolase [Sulfolobales archaeon]MDW8010196.1 MBL fold metallo-hydrolase [Sulfolobales archaeon]
MILRWHGHACFELVDRDGFTVVIDPHDGSSLGLKPPAIKADAVLITHEHFDHNAYSVVAKPGAEKYSMKEGVFTVGRKHRALGVRLYHDKVRGRRRGEVVVYKVEVDGVRVLHLGDLGHVFEESTASMLKPVDVLLVPVGGTFTIDAREALEVVKLVEPRVAIPMHYWTRGLNLPLQPVDIFVDVVKDFYEVVKVDSNELAVSPEGLALLQKTRVYVLSTPRSTS